MEFFTAFDLATFIRAAGYLGLFGIIFFESGFPLGFFLPGDSLLFTAGLLASQGVFDVALLMAGCFAAAVLGVNSGYALGRKMGPRIFKREDAFLFRKSYLERARIFYEKHGGKTIVLARFLPVIRTFAPILAGAGNMRYRVFLFYNVIGAILWAVGLTVFGYYLGNVIPNVDRYIVPLVLAIIILSFIPPLFHFLRDPECREKLQTFLRRLQKRDAV